jgi:O-methyltransferase
MKRTLTRALFSESPERHTIAPKRPLRRTVFGALRSTLGAAGLELVRIRKSTPEDYLEAGHAAINRQEDAETMIGLRQLDCMQECIADVIRNNVAGDLLEAGVWRGGTTIFMRACLFAHGITERTVWVADSFAGLPRPDQQAERIATWWRSGDMAVSLEEVRGNFERYGLLDDQVQFLKGFFSDTLPKAPIQKLAILRADADLYASTMDILNHLYPKLSAGGYAIFDDYKNLPDCRRAIHEYRDAHGITEEIRHIDRQAVYWQKHG